MAGERNRIPFNDGWTVQTPSGPFSAISGGSKDISYVTLPHDIQIEQPRNASAPGGSANGYFPSSAWTYEKLFHADASWVNKWVAISFDGVAANALVYLNGYLIESRPYPYSRFTADLSGYLLPGQENKLRVEVRVHKDSRWYTGAGIYRDVELLVADYFHFAPDGISVVTQKIESGNASLKFSAKISNLAPKLSKARLEVRVLDPHGSEVLFRDTPVTIAPNFQDEIVQTFLIDSAKLWSVESPNLYTLTMRLVADHEVLDSTNLNFGIRTVEVDSKNGLRINGEELKLRGACIHLDNGLLGAVSLKASEVRKIKKLKDAGFNAVRISHNPAGQALLEACDEVGMMVMNEAFDTWTIEKSDFDRTRNFEEWWLRDIESMVFGSINHPSVILYSIGNEIPELGNSSGRTWNRRIANQVRVLDSSRPVTNGINTLLTIDMADLLQKAGGLNAFMGDSGDISVGFTAIAATPEVSAAIEEVASDLDVVGYNYADSRYELDAKEHPERVIVGSETFPKKIASNWDLVKSLNNVIGDFTWTGWDYLGEVGIGSTAYAEDVNYSGGLGREYPYVLAYCGDIDITGFRRPASYYREIVFGLRNEPFIAVQHPARFNHTVVSSPPWAWNDVVAGWSWAGYEGKPIRIEVYCDAEELELVLNGVSLGRTEVGNRIPKIADFEVVYQPGELRAVAYRNGMVISETAIHSAVGEPTMRLNMDEVTISSEGTDLAHIEISFVDEIGTLFNLIEEEVTVSLEGPAKLVGFGSSRPDPDVSFKEATQKTYDGRAMAIIRAFGAGEIKINVSSRNFGERSLLLTAAK